MSNVTFVTQNDIDEVQQLAQESDIKFILALTNGMEFSDFVEMFNCALQRDERGAEQMKIDVEAENQ
jgi:hypothetical protein